MQVHTQINNNQLKELEPHIHSDGVPTAAASKRDAMKMALLQGESTLGKAEENPLPAKPIRPLLHVAHLCQAPQTGMLQPMSSSLLDICISRTLAKWRHSKAAATSQGTAPQTPPGGFHHKADKGVVATAAALLLLSKSRG